MNGGILEIRHLNFWDQSSTRITLEDGKRETVIQGRKVIGVLGIIIKDQEKECIMEKNFRNGIYICLV